MAEDKLHNLSGELPSDASGAGTASMPRLPGVTGNPNLSTSSGDALHNLTKDTGTQDPRGTDFSAGPVTGNLRISEMDIP
ncbi:MAG: hypothetical protein ACRDQ5_07145, partial [Sciscionella sp.]